MREGLVGVMENNLPFKRVLIGDEKKIIAFDDEMLYLYLYLYLYL